MTTKIPIATVSYLRQWQRQHRRLVGSTPRRRHLYLARILALAGLTAAQTAVVTAHQARVDATYCCDFVAEAVATTLRPALFATAVLESLADGKSMVIPRSPDSENLEAFEALGAGKPVIFHSRKRNP